MSVLKIFTNDSGSNAKKNASLYILKLNLVEGIFGFQMPLLKDMRRFTEMLMSLFLVV